jgi:hypothetical protein
LERSERGRTVSVANWVGVCEAVDARDALVAGQPEVRRYRGRYILNDEPMGNYSAVATVTTIP